MVYPSQPLLTLLLKVLSHGWSVSTVLPSHPLSPGR
jgi:hypothetical protein